VLDRAEPLSDPSVDGLLAPSAYEEPTRSMSATQLSSAISADSAHSSSPMSANPVVNRQPP
jgi:hypothetical protein